MNHQLKPMPEPVKENWDKYDLESCVTEVRNLRHFVAGLFMQVKEWTGRMNDLQQTSEQKVSSFASDDARYIELSNTVAALETARTELSSKVNELDENITLIMDFLEMSGDEIAPDDTPQPPY